MPAGFPSPADDHINSTLDLHELLVENPVSSFFAVASGDSMIDAGILPGDVLVVDKSKSAVSGNVVVALVNGEYTLKRLYTHGGMVKLCADNPSFSPIVLSGFDELEIWGVVTGLARKF